MDLHGAFFVIEVKITKTAAIAPTSAFEPALVLFGADDSGKPHAAVFSTADVELAMKAAGLMRTMALPVATAECRALALGLPKGKIFASGRAFAPFVKKGAYEALRALGGEVPPVPDEPPLTVPFERLATSWEAIGVGDLVLAPESAATGWFESVVVETKLESLFLLRWHGWPDEPVFVRRRDDLALLRRYLRLTSPPMDNGDGVI